VADREDHVQDGRHLSAAPNALTVDLEEYFQVSNFDRVIDRRQWPELPSRVENATRRLLDLFERSGARATFFALGWVAERHPRLVREIAERGHELGCHGYDHELVYEIGARRFEADVARARRAIEDAAGVRVSGYRAPSYSITRASLWALEILAQHGFQFDSSIFPIRHPRYGIPEFARHPLLLQLESGARIREFPLTTWNLGLLRLPLAGGAYLRFLPAPLFRLGVRRLTRAQQPTVLYVHPWEIDPDQPRQAVPWRVKVNHYHNLEHVESRLARLLEQHRFRPMGEVLEQLASGGRLPSVPLRDAVGGRAAA
jgi:polysaccharide deacetylase family protein (PEP-CTERM system associated)